MKVDLGKPTSLSWAAFYNDCELKILEVNKGHRITLNYKLFSTRGPGLLAGHCPTLDPQTLPLHEEMNRLLKALGFMKDGRNVGVMGSHYYAHTEAAAIHKLPASLKGIDMAVFEVFRSLGLEPKGLPVLQQGWWDEIHMGDPDPEEISCEECWVQHTKMARIGDGLSPLKVTGPHDLIPSECVESLLEVLPGTFDREDIAWLSQTPNDIAKERWSLAAAVHAYDCCECSLEAFYTAVAIIAEVPNPKKRKAQSSPEL